MTIADFSRVEAFPPGEYLADELQARDWTVAQSADVLGRPVQAVSDIINGRKGSRFSRSGLRQLASSLSRDIHDPEDLATLPERFTSVGVGLVCVEPFADGAIDDAAFNERGLRGIAISGRIPRLDAVLLTLLHEAAHLQLGHPGLQLDELLSEESKGANEAAADALARGWLLADPIPEGSPVSRAFVLALAREAGGHPSVIVGRLQLDDRLPASHLRNLTPNDRSALAGWPSI